MRMPEKLAAFWQVRQPRERRALVVLAVALTAILAGSLLLSAHRERQRLRIQVPRLAAQIEALRVGADEWRKLSAMPEHQLNLPREEVRRSIEVGARSIGLAVLWKGAAELHLSGQANFDAWINWLGQVQQDYGLRVLRAKTQLAGPGLVAVDVELGLDVGKGGL